MSTDLSNAYTAGHVPSMPSPVRTARVLLFIGAGLSFVTVLGFLATVGTSAETLGQSVWVCLPAVLALVVALRMRRPTRRLYRVAIAACALWVLGALGSLGSGDPRGVTQLLVPVSVLVLLTRPPARAYFGRV